VRLILTYISGLFSLLKTPKFPSATPRTVALGTTNGPSLKLANITYAQRLGAPVSE